jgi:hypothetical protein
MMKKTLPLFLGSLAGFLIVVELFVPQPWLGTARLHLLEWAQVLAASALVLGAINLIQVNVPKIRRREEDWPYKIVLLSSAFVMFLFGIPWEKAGENPSPGRVEVVAGAEGAAPGKALLLVESARPDAVLKIDGGAIPVDGASVGSALLDGEPRAIELEPGPHRVQVYMSAVGYGELSAEFEVAAGQTAVARAELPMLWGLSGRLRTWFYDHIFFPCNATMFALLAFFIASAAFRAFRARNTEAALLLGAAIIVLLGRAPIGSLISDSLPEITNWIIDVPNNAGRRAILIGAALGAIVTGLRVLLGMERQHVGGE